jgi:hypothetical protein
MVPLAVPVQCQPVNGPVKVYVRNMADSTTFDPRQDPPKINGDLQDVARKAHEEFDEQLDATVVNASLERVSAMFPHAKIRGFVPLLVRRYVNDELHERVEQA